MGTIIERKRAKGVRYTAQIRIKRGGKVVYSDAETFSQRAAAKAWIEKREKALAKPGALEAAMNSARKADSVTLGQVIERYVSESIKEIGKTKAQVLRSISSWDIADLRCEEVTSQKLVQFGQELASGMDGKPRDPSTVGNYFSHLAKPFALAKPAWGYPLDEQALKSAVLVLKELGLISKSNWRNRRPTLEELDLLMQHFLDRQRRSPQSNPMHRIIAFAIYSTRRQDEILRIRWSDFDEQHKRVLVRDMKHPGQKVGNDQWVDLPDEAVAIIKAMPQVAEEIFPYNNDAVSAAFTRACKFLGIKDLHFHDLRHEGISRQFELGKDIPHVALVSGHRSWNSLKRYTHIRTVGDKYEGWKWLPVVTMPFTPGDQAVAELVAAA